MKVRVLGGERCERVYVELLFGMAMMMMMCVCVCVCVCCDHVCDY